VDEQEGKAALARASKGQLQAVAHFGALDRKGVWVVGHERAH
jgi:hypothetical protein